MRQHSRCTMIRSCSTLHIASCAYIAIILLVCATAGCGTRTIWESVAETTARGGALRAVAARMSPGGATVGFKYAVFIYRVNGASNDRQEKEEVWSSYRVSPDSLAFGAADTLYVFVEGDQPTRAHMWTIRTPLHATVRAVTVVSR